MTDMKRQMAEAVERVIPAVETLVDEALTMVAARCVEQQFEVYQRLQIPERAVLQANVGSSIAIARSSVHARLTSFDYAERARSAAGGASPHVSLDDLANPLLVQTAEVLRGVGFDPGRTAHTVLGPLRMSAAIPKARAEAAVAPLNEVLATWASRMIDEDVSARAAAQAEAVRSWADLQDPPR